MSNFDFLRETLVAFHAEAVDAERLARTSPRASAVQCRFVLEVALQWLFARVESLRGQSRESLGTLVNHPGLRQLLPPQLPAKIAILHQTGNRAAHRSERIVEKDSLRSVEELFHVLYWLSRTYGGRVGRHPEVRFDPARIPAGPAREVSEARLRELEHTARRKAEDHAAQLSAKEEELAAARAELAALRALAAATPDTHDYNEAATREYFVDRLLREAGWAVDRPGKDTEFPVQGMPNTSQLGFCDYVLWDDDDRPLAVVEAKATRVSPEKGKHQATLYADLLGRHYGQRPVVYFTNGYEHWFWDPEQGGAREIAGFHTKAELQLLFARRARRVALSAAPIDAAIAGRPYQQEAISRVCERLDAKHRRALVVMATGTGKTRTTIALVDRLMRAERVRRVLFLADRRNLLTQARRAFKQFLPRATVVDLLADPTAHGNVYLATYPTMMNLVDSFDGGLRRFGPGFFDLVIVDEAHRSIYQRYGALFRWFDGWLVGLTATPRGDVHHDTYALFQLDGAEPTFFYDLEDAVRDGYLVPARGKHVPFAFMQRGIRYAELPDAEKQRYESAFSDAEEGLPGHVEATAINQWVMSRDTVDQALRFVWEHGLRVDGGALLGKTIVFARTHAHAEFIVQRFDALFPELRGEMAAVIDSEIKYADDLLDRFSEPKRRPQIAVSVDMLDTGVDVPDVVNLVFFRAVLSKTKYLQMLGRGTRLRPDLFGPGDHKTHFLCFDLCGNFQYFGSNVPEDSAVPAMSLVEVLLRSRAALHGALRDDEPELRAGLLDALHAHAAGVDADGFRARARRRELEPLAQREHWDSLDSEGVEHAVAQIADLPSTTGGKERVEAKSFDLLMVRLAVGTLRPDDRYEHNQRAARELAAALLTKADALPVVGKHRELLERVVGDAFWESVSARRLEEVRVALRDVVHLVERTRREVVEVDLTDTRGEATDVAVPGFAASVDVEAYRRRVEAYVRQHQDHTSIFKLRHARPLTPVDLEALEALLLAPEAAGDSGTLELVLGGQSLSQFIRRLVGLDPVAVRAEFERFLAGVTLSATQIRFVDTLLGYLTRNGGMELKTLYEPPFTDLNRSGVDGVFDDDTAERVIAFVRRVGRVPAVIGEAEAAG